MYIFEMLYYKAVKDSVIKAKGSLDGEKDMRKSILSGPGTIADGINVAWNFNLTAESDGAVCTAGTLQVCLVPLSFQYQKFGHCSKYGFCFIRKLGYV